MLTSQHQFTTYQNMCSGLWGSHKGILLVCFLLSKLKYQISLLNFDCRSVFMWLEIFLKKLLEWMLIKKDAFSKIYGYVWMWHKSEGLKTILLKF